MKQCWNIYESTDNNFQRLAALKLAKECHEANLFKRLESFSNSNGSNEYDDDYYIAIGSGTSKVCRL